MLATMTNAPANWHFISITFDPANDTPEMLKAYGGSYRYDPAHWSFLTGPPDTIAMLASSCGVEYQPDAGTFNHNFRTLIVDASGHLQMIFPTAAICPIKSWRKCSRPLQLRTGLSRGIKMSEIKTGFNFQPSTLSLQPIQAGTHATGI